MLVIAHKGASGYAPENTLSAIKRAIELDADMIEIDVRICKSGELVVIHDALLHRVTNGKGRVKDKMLIELQELVVEETEKIITLTEVLAYIQGKVPLDVNVKSSSAILPTAIMLQEYIEQYKCPSEEVILSSSNIVRLYDVKKKYPRVTIAPMIFWGSGVIIAIHLVLKPTLVKVSKRCINRWIINFSHRRNMRVHIWTINKKKEIEKMKILGVNGVITNYPDLEKKG